MDTVRLGISACLLGRPVRYDGGHKRDAFLTETLGQFVEWVPVCPEEEAGFGTPRPPMRLVERAGAIRLLTVRDERDVTARLRDAATARVADLETRDLDGYVFKKDSPSCGLERVKVYGESGPGRRVGRGLFADAVCRRWPWLPVEEEGRLGDPRLRENFIERVFAHRRLRALFASPVHARDLVRFHTQHKLLVLAHSPAAYAALGRLVASARGRIARALADRYRGDLMAALTVPATRGRHANVLQHMAGYFRGVLDDRARAHLAEAIDDYRRGLVPLVVPVSLLSHYARLHEVAYLLDQTYLQPHPKELLLRNHV